VPRLIAGASVHLLHYSNVFSKPQYFHLVDLYQEFLLDENIQDNHDRSTTRIEKVEFKRAASANMAVSG
jgi:hypothetical protein